MSPTSDPARHQIPRGRSAEDMKKSAALASTLTRAVEEEQVARREKGLNPLMALTFPSDCATVPRVLAYAFDEELKKKLIELYDEHYKKFPHSEYCSQWLARLAAGRRVLEINTGISELKFEFAVCESFLYPDSTPTGDSGDPFFPIIALFHSSDYMMRDERLTQAQFDRLRELLKREPMWYIAGPRKRYW